MKNGTLNYTVLVDSIFV